jgi:hypothetical protein
MDFCRKAGLALALIGVIAVSAQASITYSYVETASSSGSTTTVNVYLSEVLTGTSSSFIQSNNGLFGAGFGINVSSGNATITGAGFNTQTLQTISSTPNSTSGFGTNGPGNTKNIATDGSNAAVTESVGSSDSHGFGTPNQSTTSSGTTTNLYFLGSFTISAGSKDTVFKLTDLNQSPNTQLGNGNTGVTITTTNGYDLDFTDGGSGSGLPTGTFTGADNTVNTFTVAAVPEPSSLALCGLAAIGMGYGVYRRRKTRALESVKPDESPVVLA